MPTPTSSLRSVIDRLPFSVDDTEAANDAFRRWVDDGDPEAEHLVDLWTYCYISRYFITKSTRGEFDSAADADALISRASERVRNNRQEVQSPDCYASWVSVVCKNTFLNYTRRDRYSDSIEEEKGPELKAENRQSIAELGFVREAFVNAIQKLPTYLQEPARLYFLEGREFEEIGEMVDKPVATVRTYKHKAAKRLRKDDTLREYIDRSNL